MTDIQFASNDLVVVAAKCLAELSNASSVDAPTQQSAGDAATNKSASCPAENKTQSVESESTEHNQSEKTLEQSSKQQGEGDSPGHPRIIQGGAPKSKDSSDQRATAQDSTQQSSSATTQPAAAQTGASTLITSVQTRARLELQSTHLQLKETRLPVELSADWTERDS